MIIANKKKREDLVKSRGVSKQIKEIGVRKEETKMPTF
jgi:hypothetical protein